MMCRADARSRRPMQPLPRRPVSPASSRDGHTTLALLLLAVHVEGEGEGRLAQGGGLLLQDNGKEIGGTASATGGRQQDVLILSLFRANIR